MGLRVLLVEDNPDHALLTKRALERDARVSCVDVFSDAMGALQSLADGPGLPDLILVDIRLPGISGFELLGRLKAMPATLAIPVVLLSTSARESEVRRGLDAGACAFISKPLRPDDLFSRLTALGFGDLEPKAGEPPAEVRTAPELRPHPEA